MRLVAAGLLVALVLSGCLGGTGERLQKGVTPSPAHRPPPSAWADAASAQVRPGAIIHTPQRDCPSNFLFTRPDNTSVFLGSTAYCFRGMPIGTLVTVGGPDNVGILVYSSWETMAEIDEKDADAREYNDFAVVRLDESVRPAISPSILGLGGPTAPADPTSVPLGERVRAYVNGTGPTDALVTGRSPGSWAILVHGIPPALPGHMGAPVVDAERGQALGVIVDLGVTAGVPGSNGVARLDKLMDYAMEHAKLPMRLQTADFKPSGLSSEASCPTMTMC